MDTGKVERHIVSLGIQRCSFMMAMCLLSVASLLLSLATGAEEFLDSKHLCSASCMAMLSKVDSGPNPSRETTLILGDRDVVLRYEQLANRVEKINEIGSEMNFRMDVGSTGARVFATEVLGKLPLVGSVASEFIGKVVEQGKESATENMRLGIRAGLMEIENDSPSKLLFERAEGLKKLAMIDDALHKVRALTGNETLFSGITDPRVRDEVMQSAIRLLAEAAEVRNQMDKSNERSDLKKQVKANTNEIRQARARFTKMSIQMDQLQKAQADLNKNLLYLNKGQNGNENELSTTVADDRRHSVDSYRKAASVVRGQLDAASGIFNELGIPELARMTNLASGTVNLASSIAQCSIDPTAILPTVLSGFQFLKGFLGGGPDPIQQSLQKVLEVQTKILKEIEKLEAQVRQNHQEVMKAITIVNHNVILNYELLRSNTEQELIPCTFLVNPEAYYPRNHEYANFIRPQAQTRFSSYDAFFKRASSKRINNKTCKEALTKHFSALNGDIAPVFHLSKAQYIMPSDGKGAGTVGPRARAAEYQRTLSEKYASFLQSYTSSDYWPTLAHATVSTHALEELLSENKPQDSDYHRDIVNNLFVDLDPIAVQRYVGLLVGTHFYFELTDDTTGKPFRRDVVLKDSGDPRDQGLELLQWSRTITDVAMAQLAVQEGHFLLPLAYGAWKEKDDSQLVCGDGIRKRIILQAKRICPEKEEEVGDSDPVLLVHRLKETMEKFRTLLLGNTDGKEGLLSLNPLFARNLVLFGVLEDLAKRKHSALAYDVAYSAEETSSLLSIVLGEDWDIRWSAAGKPELDIPNGWYVVINNVNIPLPLPPQVYSRAFYLQPKHLGLLDVQRRVAKEIAGYEVTIGQKAFQEKELKWMKNFMLIGNSPF